MRFSLPTPRRTATRILLALALLAPLPAVSQTAQAASPPATPEAPAVWAPDQFCWAYYEPDGAWYAAHVVEAKGDSVRVQHLDGFTETVGSERVRRDEVAVGDTLGAYYRGGEEGGWFQATVVERKGLEVVVQYSDEERESTWLRWVRIAGVVPEPSS